MSPVAAARPVLRALLRPRFPVWISLKPYSATIAEVASVDPSSTTMTSKRG